MHRILFCTVLAAGIIFKSQAQQLPLFTQYMFDPYLINPSMVASSGQSEINALYRRQWTQIQDGPKTMQFDIQHPLNNKMALGVNIYNDQTVLLNATSALVTFGYKVQLAREHTLGFGLSAGMFANRINLSGVPAADLGDPALLSNNNTSLNGQFGAHYKFRNLTLGYSLVSLVERKTFTPESFQTVKFGALKNQIMYASYRFTVQEARWYLQPNIAYRTSADKINYYEVSGIVSYVSGSAGFDLGGGYRQNFGPSIMARASWKSLQIGFAYDFPGNQAQVSTGGTQEVQVKYRFGKVFSPIVKKNISSTPPGERSPVQEENQAAEESKQKAPEKNTVAETTPVQPANQEAAKVPVTTAEQPAPVVAKTVTEQVKTTPPVAIPVEQKTTDTKAAQPPSKEPVKVISEVPVEKTAGPVQSFYYVIGTFESQANAQAFYNTAKKKGLIVEIKESKPSSARHYFYVHMPKYKTNDISLEQLLQLQKSTGYKEAWFTKID